MGNPVKSIPGTRYVKTPTKSAAEEAASLSNTVAEILRDVRARGNAAVQAYTRAFDKVELQSSEVTTAERDAALDALDPQTRADTRFAIERVRAFVQTQFATIGPLEMEALPGLYLGHRVIPIERVGCYVPGGRYPLLSAPVMTIVPAKVAAATMSSPACRRTPTRR